MTLKPIRSSLVCALLGPLVHCIPVGSQDLRATLFADADRALEQRAREERRVARAGDIRSRHRSLRGRRSRLRTRPQHRAHPQHARVGHDALSSKPRSRRDRERDARAVIKTRDDASKANAATFADELWAEAGESFDSSARRLETGDIRGARSQADEAEALFRDAELTAIKAQYLSQTRALLAEADQARVPRLAPRTYEKARSLLAEAERELSENRYDTDLPRSLAQQANYEARHAIYLAALIDRLRGEDRRSRT